MQRRNALLQKVMQTEMRAAINNMMRIRSFNAAHTSRKNDVDSGGDKVLGPKTSFRLSKSPVVMPKETRTVRQCRAATGAENH